MVSLLFLCCISTGLAQPTLLQRDTTIVYPRGFVDSVVTNSDWYMGYQFWDPPLDNAPYYLISFEFLPTDYTVKKGVTLLHLGAPDSRQTYTWSKGTYWFDWTITLDPPLVSMGGTAGNIRLTRTPAVEQDWGENTYIDLYRIGQWNSVRIVRLGPMGRHLYNLLIGAGTTNADTLQSTLPFTGQIRNLKIAIYDPRPAPTLYSPLNMAVGVPTKPDLVWPAGMDRYSHRLQLALDSNFTQVVYDTTAMFPVVYDTTAHQDRFSAHLTSALQGNKKYFWRVTRLTSWSSVTSATWSFTTLTPGVLLSPSDNATAVPTSPKFMWTASVGNPNPSYRFQLSTSPDFSTVVCDSAGIVDTTLQVPWLSGNTRYYWRIVDYPSGTWSMTTLSGPYTGSRIVLPGTIDLAQFDAGGEGVTYHDTEADNFGASTGKCRTAEGVDLERCQDAEGAPFNIGWTHPGEWTRYSVTVSEAGLYRVEMRVATFSAGQIHLDLDGTDISGPISYNSTGGWQTWATVTDTVDLPSGDHYLYLRMDLTASGDDGNLNQLRFRRVTLAAPTLASPANGTTGVSAPSVMLGWNTLSGATSYRVQLSTSPSFSTLAYDSTGIPGTSHKVEWLSGATQYWWRVYAQALGTWSSPSLTWSLTTRTGPYTGTRVSLPGTIEVAQYDAGGEGISYHDTEAENLGAASKYRTSEGVDVERSQDADGSRYNIAWARPGEWLRYSVNVSQGGYYRMDARVATPWPGRFHLEVDGEDITGPVRYGNTGGWQSWVTVSDTVFLAQGDVDLYLRMDDTASSFYSGNINQIQFAPVAAPASVRLVFPPNGATVASGEVTFSWASVPSATWYELQFGIDSSLVTYPRADTSRVMTLAPGVRYSWRVRAHNVTGFGPYSPTWTVTTSVPLPGQIHLNTYSTITSDSCIFTWHKDPAATRYCFEIALDSLFTSFSSVDSLLTDTAKTFRKLENGRSYYWRVRGGNSGGWGPFSETGKVQVIINSLAGKRAPTSFALLANYPNPFNPSTTIQYELPVASVVRLSVFDLLGREVAVLVNERREAGVHEVTFVASNLASGIYIYRLSAGAFIQVRKMVLTK